MSYTNGCISEYVACHIFEMLGFRVQDTLLGNYTDSRGKSKLVVASKRLSRRGILRIDYTIFVELVRFFRAGSIDRVGIIPKATRTNCECINSREIQPFQFGAAHEHFCLEVYGRSSKLCRL